jgi:A/G-specific adenine glycosylase
VTERPKERGRVEESLPSDAKANDSLGSATSAFPETVSPYGTWVSEVMLQQTRVETVVSYWTRWMARFPTVAALAAASPDTVNALWTGLGYYRRARFLHDGAKQVLSEFGGNLPGVVSELEKIKGIGKYTAGAIASIAFKQRVPVVDGNVIRVMFRLRALLADPKHAAALKHLWGVTATLVDPDEPGAFNQALMELGATICTPKSPRCADCPVAELCLARTLFCVADLDSKAVSQLRLLPGRNTDARPPLSAPTQNNIDILAEAESRAARKVLKTTGTTTFPSCPLCAARGNQTPVTSFPLVALKKAPIAATLAVCVVSARSSDLAAILNRETAISDCAAGTPSALSFPRHASFAVPRDDHRNKASETFSAGESVTYHYLLTRRPEGACIINNQ